VAGLAKLKRVVESDWSTYGIGRSALRQQSHLLDFFPVQPLCNKIAESCFSEFSTPKAFASASPGLERAATTLGKAVNLRTNSAGVR
jgi:hypothetical protein